MSIIQEALKKAEDISKAAVRPSPAAAEEAAAAPEGGQAVPSAPAKDDPARPKGDLRGVAVLTLLLVLVACFAAGQIFGKKASAPKPPQPPPEAAVRAVETTPPVPAVPKNTQPQEAAAATSIRNIVFLDTQQAPAPGREKSQPGEAERKDARPDFVLNGIMYIDESPKAIINNVMVGSGDAIAGATVVRIEKRKVVLLYEEEEFALALN